MRPDGLNSPKEQAYPSLTERMDGADVSKLTSSNEVDNISADVNKKIQEFFSQGSEDNEEISKGEKEQLGTIKTSVMNLYYRVRSEYVKAEGEVFKKYKTIADNLLVLMNKLRTAADGKNPNAAVSLEPDEVDAQQTGSGTKNIEITAEELRIPDKKFEFVSENKKECEQIKNEYARIFNDSYQSNRKIASDLKIFQAKYENELKTVASSINIGRKDSNETLFDQVERQIRYYEKLAEKDIEQAAEKTKSDIDKVQVHWAGVQKGKGPKYGEGSRISQDMQVVHPDSEYNKERMPD